jgi:hypothetical protein
MARTIAEIKKEITDDFIDNDIVIEKYGLDPREKEQTFEQQFSRVSLESIIFYLHAFRVWLLETLFDKHIEEVDDMIRNKRSHTVGWYRQTAMAFQYGEELSDDVAEYDNSNLTSEQIEEMRIITKCAVLKAESVKPTLIIKVAKSGECLDAKEKEAFTKYMENKADAGVTLRIVTGEPDILELSISIRHDGLVLDQDGRLLIDKVKKPIEEATERHLKNLVFNGTFFPSLLEQDLMKLPGVKVATVLMAQARPVGGTLTQFTDAYIPVTGTLNINVKKDLGVSYETI